MATLEMVEKLRERANVSYDEAKEALDACGDDLLEAMIYLEKLGKVKPPEEGGYYSSKHESPDEQGEHTDTHSGHSGENFGDILRRFFCWTRDLVRKGNSNRFEVLRQDTCILSVPVTILVLLAIFCFWVVLPMLLVGLFCGCKYRFRGPQMDDTQINDFMETASEKAEHFKTEMFTDKERTDDRQD